MGTDDVIYSVDEERAYKKGCQNTAENIFEEIETSLSYKLINGEIHFVIREVDYNHYKKKYTESEDTQ